MLEGSTSNISYTPTHTKKKPTAVIVTVAVIALLLIGGGIFFFTKGQKKSEPTTDLTTVDTAPKETPTPEVDKSKLKIQVLNGTGTEGQAGKASDALKSAGFSDIKTGNASKLGNTKTTVQTKKEFASIAEDIKSALDSDFDNVEVSEDSLTSDSDFDVIITTGGKAPATESKESTNSAATTTPTVTPSPTPTP